MNSSHSGNSEPVRAAIYCRMSLAALDDTTKVDDQERLCRTTAEHLGWDVGTTYGHPLLDGVYQDNNRSAWRHNRKRPAWSQMLADIEAGLINAIVVYHGDRLTRQPMDLEILIMLSRTRGIKLASPTGVRDLNNDDDQFTLGIEANVYRKESASTSRRRKQQYERWRREGRVRPGGRGGRAYGFATDGLALIPEECEVIREMARRVLAGEYAGTIARDMSARGARTPTGAAFTHGTVRKMLARPRYAGLMPDGENAAAWEPVLDRETWEAVRHVLATKADKYTWATNARRWLLSGIAECGAPGCGSRLQVRQSKDRRSQQYVHGYACVEPGCRKVYRSAPLLDAYVAAATVERLANPGNPDGQRPANVTLAGEFQVLAAERSATEQKIKDYRTSPGTLDLLMARLGSIDARLAELRELASDDGRARIMQAHAGVTYEEFTALPLATRRALVSACYRVKVLPASKRGPGFRTEDVLLSGR